MFSYRLFLRQAWQITKTYKHLWFFGLFAALLYASGEYQVINSFLRQEHGGAFGSTWLIIVGTIFSQAFWLGIIEIFYTDPTLMISIIILTILTIAIFLAVLYVSIISQAALVKQSAKIINSKKKVSNLNIGDGLKKANKWFWSVLWLNLSAKLIITICFFILSIPLLFVILTNSQISLIVYTLLFLIFLPITLFVSFVVKFAIASSVIENNKYKEAIKRAYYMFKDNWLVSFELAFILFFINFIIALLTLTIITFFFISLYIIGIMITSISMVIISIMLAIGLAALSASLLGVFQTAAWTGLFLKLKESKGKSKIERIFKKNK